MVPNSGPRIVVSPVQSHDRITTTGPINIAKQIRTGGNNTRRRVG